MWMQFSSAVCQMLLLLLVSLTVLGWVGFFFFPLFHLDLAFKTEDTIRQYRV